jgi:3-dehydroquinate dehydratase/shikimate dehydrogenase
MANTQTRMRLFGRAKDRICAVVAAATATEMKRQIRLALRETRTIELRLDWLRSDAERKRLLCLLPSLRRRRITFLATCRRIAGGGKLSGGPEEELFWLVQAREAGCSWCDLEMETFRELPEGFVREFPIPKRILLSIHDFAETPRLPRKIRVSAHGQLDAVKIAVKANSIADGVRVLEVARRSRGLVAVPMGEMGLPARILALAEGSELAYAPVETPTAPGQVGLHEFKHLYRAHALTRRSAVYGVIGNPIAHSLSPLLHNTGFAERGMDAVYLPFLVTEMGDFLEAIPKLRIRGFSVTLPHKEAILKHLAECDPLAEEIGAVNTVAVRSDGSLHGYNTDYIGVLHALQHNLSISGSRVLILGAGGAARAAAFALARAGAGVAICARREHAARALARAVGGEAVPRRALRTERFDAILNATPIGMHPQSGVSPLSPSELNCHLVMDLIYRPQRTKLMRLAAARGIKVVPGVEMFLVQGFAQWRIWMGRRPPETAMRRAVLARLRLEEKAR